MSGTDFFGLEGDPVTKQWFWASFPALGISLVAYGLFHILYKPDFNLPVTHRQHWTPIKNLAVSLANATTCYMLRKPIRILDYAYCQSVGSVNLKESQSWEFKLREAALAFFFVKLLECSDTIVIAFRGGQMPIYLFLHHFYMIILAWIGLRYIPSGTTSNLVLINSIGHALLYAFLVVMYAFPSMRNKYYVVQTLNLVQFILIFIICISTIFLDCGYPTTGSIIVAVTVMIWLFFFTF